MQTPIQDSSPTFELSEILRTIGAVVTELFGDPVWIRCEVISAQAKTKGYWVLQVQDAGEQGRKASAQVFVWNASVPAVVGRFRRETGQDLAPGMQIRLLAVSEFSAEWGFRLVAKGIDPAWSIGAAQNEADAIRQRLEQEKIWLNNRALPAPKDFTRVLLVAPDGSAGLGDVMRDAHLLEQAGVCAFDVRHAPFEGPNAAPALTRLLREPFESGVYDAVCMVRGGGGTAGLNTLNDEELVRAVCECPLPVIVGIGHERDRTLLDEVAHTSLGTPSKAIGHIVGMVVARAQQAHQDWLNITQAALRRVEEAGAKSDERWAQVGLASLNALERASIEADSLVREAMGLGPQATLQRGYAWIQGPSGPVISRSMAQKEPLLMLNFHDGAMAVRPEPTP